MTLEDEVSRWLLRNQAIRNRIPPRVKSFYAENRPLLTRCHHRSPLDNLFHACVHKTGSQWIRRILADPVVYQYSGLRFYAWDLRRSPRTRAADTTVDAPVPRRRVITPMFMPYEAFMSGVGDRAFRSFFVWRDPRDMVVSWLFSTREAHPNFSDNPARSDLLALTTREGLEYGIDYLIATGEFEVMASWVAAENLSPDVRLVRYADLVGEKARQEFVSVFEHLQVPIPDDDMTRLLERHSFTRQTGRAVGVEDRGSKMRKGSAGDWRNYFDGGLEKLFEDRTGDLLGRLGLDGCP